MQSQPLQVLVAPGCLHLNRLSQTQQCWPRQHRHIAKCNYTKSKSVTFIIASRGITTVPHKLSKRKVTIKREKSRMLVFRKYLACNLKMYSISSEVNKFFFFGGVNPAVVKRLNLSNIYFVREDKNKHGCRCFAYRMQSIIGKYIDSAERILCFDEIL